MSDKRVIDEDDLSRWADDGGRHPHDDGADAVRDETSEHQPGKEKTAS